MGRKTKSYDQLYVFAKQLHAEDFLFQHGVDLIVTDSPLLMQICYARDYDFPACDQLMAIGRKFEIDYPSLNVFFWKEAIFLITI